MKTCPYCMKQDLHDRVKKCPHCGAWLSKLTVFRGIAETVGWIFLVVFIVGLASCGLMVFK
jgi:hypothetical protein